MAQYIVPITDGSGSKRLPIGTYDVTSNVTGYTGSLDPTTFTATAGDGNQSFKLAAQGTLTLNVNESGSDGGTPVTSGTCIRCSADGNTTYGTEKTISATGDCEFDHVPFGTQATPAVFYIKQLTSDDTHNIYDAVITISMESQTQTNYVKNDLAGLQTFALEDEYYSGLNLDGSLTFDKQ